ncbi:MAG: anti-sigma factor antagonist [Solirubrobacteraceae bacterium]|jgi:anti-anti-sigma factor|nr:anti-sigma factor antagonist [Solirubrobacteraceae bacterium]
MLATSASQIPPFSVRVVHDRDEVVVELTGELDIASADELEREIRELRADGVACVVIDLRGVDFLDSTGLRTLISLRNAAKRAGHGLVVVPGPPRVQRIFELTATRSLFDWRA